MGTEVKNIGIGEVNCDDDPRYCKSKMAVAEINQFQICRNPLELPPVIKNVFRYLDAGDIKSSRLVSKEWSSAGLGVLFTRSKIKFRSPEKISEFFQRFYKSSFEVVPFKKFGFVGRGESWSVSALSEFLHEQGKYVTELNFEDIQVVEHIFGQKLATWNITPWISNCVLTKEIMTNGKTELAVICDGGDESTKISVDFGAFDGIKELTLKNVTVNLQDGIQISPTKLNFSGVKLTKYGMKLAHLHLNDVIDFSNAKYVGLKRCADLKDTRLTLELNGVGNLDHLALSEVSLVNFRDCRWAVNKLFTYGGTLTGQTQMQIKELVMIRFRQSLNISNIPLCLEKLTVKAITTNTFLFTRPIVLKNIKFLQLNFFENVFALFNENLKFPNLTHLYLEKSFSKVEVELDVAWLPKSVKVISLIGLKMVNVGNEGLRLDRLILGPAHSFKIEEFCNSQVQTKELVLNFSYINKSLPLYVQKMIDILEHQKFLCQHCVVRFYVATMCWGVSDFDASPLRFYVDKEADCYLFENRRGQALQKKDFNLLIDMNEIYNKI